MRLVVNLLAILGTAIAILTIGNLYFGLMTDAFTGENGMAILFFQLWGAIGSGVAIVFGLLGRFMDSRVPQPARFTSNLAVAIGLLCGLLLFAAPLVFG